MTHCNHRNGEGNKMETWRNFDHVEVCARCVHGVENKMQPVSVARMFAQMDYAATEMRAMTGMMREVGMEVHDDEVMGTAEQFEEFKKRWTEKYPDRSFTAMYGSKGEG